MKKEGKRERMGRMGSNSHFEIPDFLTLVPPLLHLRSSATSVEQFFSE
jgi:hypothetical protein